VFLVGGCTLATALQPPSFNWLASTVSTLTEREAADPWVMTAVFAVTGACEMATALALRPAAMPGRLILAAAGAASVLVAANPEHVGGSPAHGLWAGVTFTALIAWPTGAWRRGPSVPWGLRSAVSAAAVATLLALLAWYLMELTTKGGMTGLAERVMGTAEVAWPLAVVLSCGGQRSNEHQHKVPLADEHDGRTGESGDPAPTRSRRPQIPPDPARRHQAPARP
jgi:hypothetical membrane protein